MSLCVRNDAVMSTSALERRRCAITLPSDVSTCRRHDDRRAAAAAAVLWLLTSANVTEMMMTMMMGTMMKGEPTWGREGRRLIERRKLTHAQQAGGWWIDWTAIDIENRCVGMTRRAR